MVVTSPYQPHQPIGHSGIFPECEIHQQPFTVSCLVSRLLLKLHEFSPKHFLVSTTSNPHWHESVQMGHITTTRFGEIDEPGEASVEV